MESIVIFIFFVILTIIVFNGTLDNNTIDIPKKDTSGHVKPEHLLYDLLKQYSSGDKLYLAGKCKVNLYSKYIIPAEMKREFTNLLNRIFQSVYKVTNNLFQVQEFNNIYEQIDNFSNKRYIIDATLNAITNYYTTRVILDIVIINNEIFVNFISINNASNNNIIDRYDVIFKDQGILFNHNNFTTNVRSLLDQEYREKYRLISFQSKYLDSKNYDFKNVLSLNSLLKNYLPSTLSSNSEKNLKMKGLEGQLEMYFPSDLPMAKSPQFCNKYLNGWSSDSIDLPGNENCVFNHNSTETEYNQPYMGPGLFFNRSSYPKDL
jgi:hypothetical protein